MSIHSSITFTLQPGVDANLLFNELIYSNFNVHKNGLVSYAKLGEQYAEWIEEELSTQDLLTTLAKKLLNNEDISFILYFNNKVGAIFDWVAEGDIATFSLTINRITLGESMFTDFSWYLNILIRIIVNVSTIQSIECEDIY